MERCSTLLCHCLVYYITDSIYPHLPQDPSFWNTSENRSKPNPSQCSYSLWTLLSSHSRLLMSRVAAIAPTGFVGGFVGDNSIISYATGSSHHKRVYHHPDSSHPPPAQSCIQRGHSQQGLSATTKPPLLGTESAGQVSSLAAAWLLLCFIEDPAHDRQTSPNSYLLSPSLLASAQLGKPSEAKRWVQLQQPACTVMPLPLQRRGWGTDAEA